MMRIPRARKNTAAEIARYASVDKSQLMPASALKYSKMELFNLPLQKSLLITKNVNSCVRKQKK